ncbi:TIGR01777 family oxidoreductase [Mesobacillus subterraneus]|uniref:TIGR01777 family oxidoreductase n=1 Tax=Mesobacillus subterraneus TaxID=285983 RepID=UPI00203DFB86|nr:TIGR01777 family oxidoreductase [Mesobacillus subterraneus]MCM3667056.1 TIGR01777 family oxidoreductase [Mesobacillus subterraneus]MCM3685025.1 TIGR01777 family oxidoreductase [Mesobacillus subterraneus]
MKIAITGGTGLVGKALSREMINSGHEVFILTRNKASSNSSLNPKYVSWLNEGDQPELELEGIDAIVNLAGATINSRWTDDYKRKILDSRLQATSEVKGILKKLIKKPEVLVNASAVGFYGTSLTEEFTEQAPAGNDFLAETVEKWEGAASQAEDLGVRVVLCRFGVILDKHGGALPRMVLPYKLFGGGKIGSGKQWLSWIHIQDAVSGIMFAIDNKDLKGPVNFSAPSPVTMDQFGKTLASVLQKPHWMPVPSFILKMLLGEMSILVLEGQRVHPEKLLRAGFVFRYLHLKEALKDIFGK